VPEVGSSVGLVVGLPVGELLGWSVGVEVGSLVGVEVGVLLGVGLGVPVAGCRGVLVCVRDVPLWWLVPVTAEETLVPLACDPPSSVESGFPITASSPVRDPRVSTSTATAVADRCRKFECREGVLGGSGAIWRTRVPSRSSTALSGAVAASEPGETTRETGETLERVTRFAVRRTAALLRRNDAVYIDPATVAITLATAAPMIVPATPR
jgi:hypothetical protein